MMPLVLNEMQCSYHELLWSISQLPACSSQVLLRHQKTSDEIFSSSMLPVEMVRHIGSFLTIEPVVSSKVRPIRASSNSDKHILEASLDEGSLNGWTSKQGSMPMGKGDQYVEYDLGDRLCRFASFSIQINPLPLGPLSVRTMRLEGSCVEASNDSQDVDASAWKPISPTWTIQNRTEWQLYYLPKPVDVRRVRVVCLTNQMSVVLQHVKREITNPNSASRYDFVGYNTIKFE